MVIDIRLTAPHYFPKVNQINYKLMLRIK